MKEMLLAAGLVDIRFFFNGERGMRDLTVAQRP
jgi:hypothetical protein